MTTQSRSALIAVAWLLLWQWGLMVAQAAEFVVTRLDDPQPNQCLPADCSLRSAIIAANNNPGADTITFQAAKGTYQLKITGLGENVAATGDLDVLDSLTIKGKGQNNTIISGLTPSNNPNALDFDRVFHIIKGDFAISSLTIQGGIITKTTVASSVGDDGGGIAYGVSGGILSVIDSRLRNNQARVGGGIFSNGDDAIINIINSTISENYAVETGGGLNPAQVKVTDLNILGSSIINNTTDGNGGGIYFFSDPDIGEKVVMNIINTTISGNKAVRYGGGINNDGIGEVNLQNSTIVFNTAGTATDKGGGGGGIASTYRGKFNVSHSIIANNTDGRYRLGSIFYAHDCLAPDNTTMRSLGHNLIGNNIGCEWPTTRDDLVGEEPNNVIDPKLDSLKTTTSALPFHPLLAGSPAIDQGVKTVGGQLGACAFIDQQGFGRPVGDSCDIGAYESGATQPALSLTIIKSGPDIIQRLGDTITYTLIVINSSLLTATRVSISDTVPSGAFYLSGGDVFTSKPAPGAVAWFNGPLYQAMPPNTLMAVTFAVTSNQAVRNEIYQVSADGFGSGGFTGVGTGLAEPSFAIEKTGPSRAPEGREITYTLTVRNDGKAEGFGVVITDTLPTGATYIRASDGGGLDGQTVSWKVDSLRADGGEVNITVVVTATHSITNSLYRVTAFEETRTKSYSQTGTIVVFTQVGKETYLPVMRKNQ